MTWLQFASIAGRLAYLLIIPRYRRLARARVSAYVTEIKHCMQIAQRAVVVRVPQLSDNKEDV